MSTPIFSLYHWNPVTFSLLSQTIELKNKKNKNFELKLIFLKL